MSVSCSSSYSEPLAGVHFNHATQKVLTVWWNEVRHVEHSQLHLLQEIPQVVIIKRQSALEKKMHSIFDVLFILFIDYDRLIHTCQTQARVQIWPAV